MQQLLMCFFNCVQGSGVDTALRHLSLQVSHAHVPQPVGTATGCAVNDSYAEPLQLNSSVVLLLGGNAWFGLQLLSHLAATVSVKNQWYSSAI
jgi:hypothetical protein